MEQSGGSKAIINPIKRTLRLTEDGDLIIRKITENLTPERDIIFLTGIEKAWPIIRSHTILNNLHSKVDKNPLVMFFPGNYTNELRLFGEITDDNYYRAFPFVYEDYPFDNITDAGVWTVMRHKANRKSFALIYERNGKLCVNLKCEPLEADFLRQAFAGVTPAYHMNKTHWNTVIIGSDVPNEELFRQIEKSYDLIKPKARRKP